MWLQKKDNCPLCRNPIEKKISLYYPNNGNITNNKLNYLFFSIENLKLDNYGRTSEKCLVCGNEEPKEQLITCQLCNFFQSHILCDPPIGLSHERYFCGFCRKKFLDSLKK